MLLAGNLTNKESQPFAHLHIVLGGRNHEAVAGHLFEGKTGATCELIVRPLTGFVQRKLDPATGLYLLDLVSAAPGFLLRVVLLLVFLLVVFSDAEDLRPEAPFLLPFVRSGLLLLLLFLLRGGGRRDRLRTGRAGSRGRQPGLVCRNRLVGVLAEQPGEPIRDG